MPASAFTPANWAARHSDNAYQYASGFAVGNNAFITMTLVGADIGIDQVTYYDNPSELFTQGTAVALATFIDYVIT